MLGRQYFKMDNIEFDMLMEMFNQDKKSIARERLVIEEIYLRTMRFKDLSEGV